MAVLKRHQPIIKRVQAVASVVGAGKLHIFGVGVISVVRAFRQMGIHSIDSLKMVSLVGLVPKSTTEAVTPPVLV